METRLLQRPVIVTLLFAKRVWARMGLVFLDRTATAVDRLLPASFRRQQAQDR